MIRLEGLKKKYKNVLALNKITLHVLKGEMFAYLGPNGSGKTTTVNILTGLTEPSAGDAFLNNFHIQKESLQAKLQSGLVTQRINLDNELTVYENLNIHGRLFHMPKKERVKKIDELLDYIELNDRKNSFIKHLSGGMKRRIVIARAMMHSPKILFLDEPTVGLDPNIRRKIWSLIKKLQQNGTTIFLTTHYIEEAEFLADRVAFLDKGEIVKVDTPQNFMDRIGKWALDDMVNDNIETIYFKNKDEAGNHIKKREGSFTLRRVNLEDAFVSLTGKKVDI
ncbi:MAG: ATP-binding cassette domain-containing protein [Deltaproteobacteria bacterium]|nr:ATP-binding cassette domain-containing protein [Deltaproteobacteria bacterium]